MIIDYLEVEIDLKVDLIKLEQNLVCIEELI